MKYQIIVEKKNDNAYLAYCPSIGSIRAESGTFSSVLDELSRELLCYLHDPKAEVEIIVKGGAPVSSVRDVESFYDAGSEAIQ